MGARFCLHLALARPDLVRRLVLISGTAGIEDDDERGGADRPTRPWPTSWTPRPRTGGRALPVAAFVRRWLDGPLFAGMAREADGLDRRRGQHRSRTGLEPPAGRHRYPAAAVAPALPALDMPVLVITGGRDDKFTALGRRLVDAIGANAPMGGGRAPATRPICSGPTRWPAWSGTHRATPTTG